MIDRYSAFKQPIHPVLLRMEIPAQELAGPNYWFWGAIVFWTGAFLFSLRFLVQLISLYKLYRTSCLRNINGFPVRAVDADISPFSFWQSIFINPKKLAPNDLENVLQHEHIHIKEWHTLDILLIEISIIFYWFNPGIWFMKKAVHENLEFVTDNKILQQGIDSKNYQYSLLHVGLSSTASTGLAHHFNISTIKKRIIMMNAKRSSNLNLIRYMFLVPAVVIVLLIFSFCNIRPVKTINKVADSTAGEAFIAQHKPDLILNSNSPVKSKTAIIKRSKKRADKILPAPILFIAVADTPGDLLGYTKTNKNDAASKKTVRFAAVPTDAAPIEITFTRSPNLTDTISKKISD